MSDLYAVALYAVVASSAASLICAILSVYTRRLFSLLFVILAVVDIAPTIVVILPYSYRHGLLLSYFVLFINVVFNFCAIAYFRKAIMAFFCLIAVSTFALHVFYLANLP